MQTPVPCQWSGAAFAGAVQGSQPQSFGLITLFLLTEHLCLPPRNEHPVPGTWLGGAFKRQAAVKDKIGKDQMWPGGLSFGDYYLQGFRENRKKRRVFGSTAQCPEDTANYPAQKQGL